MLTSPLRRPPRGKVFFLHLPKCAGSSFWQVLRGLVGDKHLYQAYSAERFRQFAEMGAATRNAFRATGGHFALAGYRAHLDLSQYFAVTTFREPVERAVSEFHYARNNPKHSEYDIIRKLTLGEFIERNPDPITRLLCGKADAAAAFEAVHEVFDRWAFVDDLPELVAAVCRHLGKPVPALPRVNVGPRTLNAIAIEPEQRALIHRLHAADVELYRMLREERDRRMQPIIHIPARPAASVATIPTFQIVTPTRDTARYLDETIASVVGQEGDFRIRYHIQDGGSRDQTLAVARDWQARLAGDAVAIRCHAVSLSIAAEPDAGMYDAVAAGFRQLAPAPQDFATYINGDDRLATGAFATVAQAFADMPDVDLVGGRKALTDARGEPQVAPDVPLYPRRTVAAGLHDGRRLPFIMQEGTFWRAGLWLRTGGVDTRLRYAGDWDLWRRFAGETDYVALDTVTGYHRRRPGQISETLDAYYRELDAQTGDGAAEREQLLAEYLRDPFPAAIARLDPSGGWVRSDSRSMVPLPRALWPIDGDWIPGPGFSGAEGASPERPFVQPNYRMLGSPAVAHIFSERAGIRTLSLWLASTVADRQVEVRINGGPVVTRTLRRPYPKATCLEFRQHFDAGATTVAVSVDRRIATAEGLAPGVTLHGVAFWNSRRQLSRLQRLLPKPLRAFV